MVDGDVGHERKSEYEQDVAPAERDNNLERNGEAARQSTSSLRASLTSPGVAGLSARE